MIKNTQNEVTSTVEFDEFSDDRFIPTFKTLNSETKNPTGKVSQYHLNMFQQYEGKTNIPQIKKNDIVNGMLIAIKEREYIIDIGNKDNIIIDRKGAEERLCKTLQIGQFIDVLITETRNNPFLIKGSIAELIKHKVERKLVEYFNNNTPIEAYVKDIIPAGFLMDVSIDGITIDAFMPNTLADVNRLLDTNSILGTKMYVMLETLQQDKDKGVYVVSRRKYLKTLIPEKIKQLRKNSKNTVYTGHVTGTKEFGIFIQFEDCLTGMIHKANIREDYRDKLMDIKAGTLIDFYVKDIIKDNSQIILTQIKGESLWDSIKVGDKYDGKVLSIKPFGALIELDYETRGLIQSAFINKNSKKLTVGETINVMVVALNRDDRKVFLTFSDDKEMIERMKEKSNEMKERNSLDFEKLKQKFNG